MSATKNASPAVVSRGSGRIATTSAAAIGRTMSAVVSTPQRTATNTMTRTETANAIATAYVRRRPDCTRATSPPTWIVPDADLVERALDDGLLDVAPERVRERHGRPVEERVVGLVEVELVLEHAPDAGVRHELPPCVERPPREQEADDRERDGDRARPVVLGDGRL